MAMKTAINGTVDDILIQYGVRSKYSVTKLTFSIRLATDEVVDVFKILADTSLTDKAVTGGCLAHLPPFCSPPNNVICKIFWQYIQAGFSNSTA